MRDGRMFGALLMAAVMGWMVAVGVLGGLAAMAVLTVRGADASPEALMAVLYTPQVVGPLTLVQMAGIAGIVWSMARSRGADWRDGVAWPAGWTVLAPFAAGLAVGPVAGYLAQEVERLGGPLGIFDSAQLVLVGKALADGPLLPRLPLLLAVLVGAPVVEELLFRGLLWSALAERMPPRAVWATTTVAFAAYHMDPLHAVALLPTAAVLGWIRLRSRSVGPAILAHFANNLHGVAWILIAGPEAQSPVGPVLAAAGLALTVGACASMRAGGRESPLRG
jgi:membrane protease YdiL (CAAX protease family)